MKARLREMLMVKRLAIMRGITKGSRMPINRIHQVRRKESRRAIIRATIRDGIMGGHMAGVMVGGQVVPLAGNSVAPL
jgi:hypothetical protein